MKQKGFTLIELLVSMGIIAVLTGMAVFNFNQARMRARDIQRKSDLGQLQKSLELYKNDNNGIYPNSPLNQQSTLVDSGYSKVVFVDPKGATVWQDYVYTYNDLTKLYTIKSCLENITDSSRVIPNVVCGPSDAGVVYQVTNP